MIPARNEAEGVGRAVASLLDQDYPGDFSIMLVDDHSNDGTAEVAREVARGREDRFTIVAARSLPGGWTGKLWALSEGVRQSRRRPISIFSPMLISRITGPICASWSRGSKPNSAIWSR